MTVGERIKQARLQRGMTQKDLAKAIKASFQTINKYETNLVNNIPLKKVQAIADALEVDAAELVGWAQDQLELNGLREQLRRKPGMRILFDAAKNANEEDLIKFARMIEAFKDGNDHS